MKAGLKKTVERLGGINQLLPQPPESATEMVNFTIDPHTGGWDNRLGYEKFFPGDALYHPFNDTERIQSMYIWTTHGGARTYHIYETAATGASTCDLKFTVGNVHITTGGGAVDLDLGRSIPLTNEPGTSYEPMGRILIITNGYDMPIKIDGDQITELGWTRVPNPPSVLRVDPNNSAGSNQAYMPFYDFTAEHFGGILETSSLHTMYEYYGLGDPTVGATNTYKWKVTWINSAGSESPISPSSSLVSWVVASSHPYRMAVYIDNIAIGPAGTVARRIYRTKNLRESPDVGADEVYYFVEEIDNNTETNYVDFLPDAAMNSLAPQNVDSVPLPTLAPRITASFKGTLFIDGGNQDPTKLFYSQPGQPDSYAASSYFDVGSREGGGIVGLVSFYNQLIVFRENAIDLIRGNPVAGFKIVPFSEGIGTDAPDTITVIKGLGVVFLAKDGVYRISGGMDGGAVLNIERLTDGLLKTLDRISKQARPRSVATFSHKWREWHCYVPVDGGTKPTLGLVFHIDNGQWSTREGFPVGAISTTKDGDLVFGTNTGKEVGATTWECGLFVVSRKRSFGYTTPVVPDGGTFTVDRAPVASTYRSAWLDFGNSQKKKFIKYVYVYALTRGDNTIPMTYYMDFGDSGTTAAPVKQQRPDHADQNVYGTGVWGVATWEEPYLTEFRYPIAQKGSSYFSFEIETSNDMVVLGYSVEFTSGETQTVRGKR